MKSFPPDVVAYTALAKDSSGQTAAGEEVPDTTGPVRFVLWLLGRQKGLIVLIALLNFAWFLPGTLNPFILGRIIDRGIVAGDWSATWGWTLLMVIVVLFGVGCNVAASTLGVANWVAAMYRITKLVARKVGQMAHVVIRRVPAGEMLSVASSDADTFGSIAEIFGRIFSAVAAFAVVAVLVLREDIFLGLIVLIATPMIVVITTPILGPLQRAQMVERERSSKLTGMAVDIVAGLRILRGIGGERTFGDNYAVQSQAVRQAGVRSGTWWGALDSVGVITTGALLVGLTWFGALEMTRGDLSVGELVGFFGYAIFLQRPVNTFFEAFQRWTASLVSATKTIGLLSQTPPWQVKADPVPFHLGQIVDQRSGFVANPGQLTIVAAAVPDESADLADRLGRYLPTDTERLELGVSRELKGQAEKAEWEKRAEARARQVAHDEALADQPWGVTIDGVDLAQMDLAEVRRRIVVNDADARVFSGTLQALVDPHGDHSREQAEQALWAVSAEDVWEAYADGWQGRIDERGRGLSGGQRQRLVLARALLMDPEVLVLVEPTSAVDAHTEARIAERLPQYRSGRTTILTTVSPLWLRHADKVVLLAGGKVIAEGTHVELMATSSAYRDTVIRTDEVSDHA